MDIDGILFPLEWVVAWIMVTFHTINVEVFGMAPTSGLAWALSIVGLVIVMRVLLIPLFVKQIKAQRGMQLLAPDLQKIQKKYKGKTDPASREAMSRETMELYRKHGTNPFSSCLPILAQSPIFFALFRVLFNLGNIAEGTFRNGKVSGIGPLTPELAAQANDATILGAKLSETFLHDTNTQAKIVSVLLIVAMSATTFLTQRQLTQKNMPPSALQGPMAQQQKMLLYLLPIIFAVSGVNFPIGVLIYWTTTNLWSMGQQFYVIRRNPTPGSEAERLLKERRARKAARKGLVLEDEAKPAAEPEKPKGQRQQPKRKDRATKRGGARPAGSPSAPANGSTPSAGATPGGTTETDGSSGTSGGSGQGPTSKKKPRGQGSGGRPTSN